MWVESSETDFNDGVYNLTIASGTGAGAQLTLSPFGNAADGNVTISATKNINTDIISSGRVTYADGINYAVSGVWISSITCSATPNGIITGDEIILINQQGDGTNYGNVGNYEFFKIASVNGNFLIFTSSITKIYGATTSNNVLTGQKIVTQRVPNWGNVTISGAAVSLTCTAWDGTKGGMVVFRATGTVSIGSGASIDVSQKGFRSGIAGTNGPEDAHNPNITTGGENGGTTSTGTGANGGGSPTTGAGNGGNHAGAGAGIGYRGGGGGVGESIGGAGGGSPYGSGLNYSNADILMLGGGAACGAGGGGASSGNNASPGGGDKNGLGGAGPTYGGDGGNGGNGESGGGIVLILANKLSGPGNIMSNGGKGGSAGGGGGGSDNGANSNAGGGGGGGGANGAAGGSVQIRYTASDWTGNINVNGGDAGGGGGGGGGAENSAMSCGGGGGGGIGGGGGGSASDINTAGNGGNAGSSGGNDSGTGTGGGAASGGGGGGNSGAAGGAANQGGNGNPAGAAGSPTVNGGTGGNGGSGSWGTGGGGGKAGNQGASGYSSVTTGISYPYLGTYKSNVLDSGTKVIVSSVSWTPSSQPGGTGLVVAVRASTNSFTINSVTPDWLSVSNGGTPEITGRYIQYMSTFTTTSSTTTPRIEDITIAYKVKPWQEKTIVRTGKNAYGFGGGENWEWEVPCKVGQLITITAYVRYNASYGAAGKPKLTLYNLGVNSNATMSASADTWEQLQVSGTPNRNGVLKLKIEGFSTQPGAKMFVDDINISQ